MLSTVIPTTEYELVSENHGHFVIEPLEPGYGLTLGNALRRILLSSLPGAAITAVRIDGVQHEFSTIPDMKEDVLEFLLNAKGIRFRYFSNRSDVLKLEVSGEKVITAGDISKSAAFEITNPDHYLATLNSPEGKLSAEFTVEIGKGYMTSGSTEGLTIGVMPTDAVFTPIKQVNYDVEKIRVEERSDYDRLILDIWTDGTISPESSLAESARILSQQFAIFANLGQPGEGPSTLEEESKTSQEQEKVSLELLGLSSRTINALRRGGISTTEALLSKDRDELLGLKNFGIKSWNEVQEQLIKAGLIESDGLLSGMEGDETVDEERSEEEYERGEMLKKLGERFTVRGDK